MKEHRTKIIVVALFILFNTLTSLIVLSLSVNAVSQRKSATYQRDQILEQQQQILCILKIQPADRSNRNVSRCLP